MKHSRFSEEQIIGILKENESGVSWRDLSRKHGVTEQTLYRWKSQFGGLDVNEARRLRHLEDENRKLKQLLAEAMLDIKILKDVNAKNW